VTLHDSLTAHARTRFAERCAIPAAELTALWADGTDATDGDLRRFRATPHRYSSYRVVVWRGIEYLLVLSQISEKFVTVLCEEQS
jgi:hypothetical protein